MNGVHDMGGMHGFGKIGVEPQDTEPVFHADWEKKAMALTMAASALGMWNIDKGRYARERQHPVTYLQNSYYENWLAGLETLLVEAGLVTAEELSQGRAAGPAAASVQERKLTADQVMPALWRGNPVETEVATEPLYSVGDQVRVLNIQTHGHTRAPRYVRGHIGTIHLHHGAHVFADLNAAGERLGHHLYNVRFDATELWRADSAGPGAVFVDLWEPYLASP